MKKHVLFLAILVALLLSATVTIAGEYIVVSGVKLPAFSGEIVGSSNKRKEYMTPQQYENMGTISGFLGKSEAVNVKTTATAGDCANLGGSSTSHWLLIGDKQKKTWDPGNVCNGLPGTYKVTLKRESNQITTATHTGVWYYNNYKYLTN